MESALRQASRCPWQAKCAACPKDMPECKDFLSPDTYSVNSVIHLGFFCNHLSFLLTTQIQGEVELVGFIRQGEKVGTS